MRVTRILLIGAAASAGFAAVGAVVSGAVGAGALIFALFLAVVTIGLAISAVVDRFVDRPVENPLLPPMASVQREKRSPRCTECGKRMTRTASIAVCRKCDQAPARR